MKIYIVWNEAKTEGYATTEHQLAYEVRKGSDTNCHHEATGEQATIAVAFCEAYADQNCTIEEIKYDHSIDPNWKETVRAEQLRVGRALTLDELLNLARPYKMTAEEIEAQRQSWARQDMD